MSLRFDGREVGRRDDLPAPGCGVPALLVAGGDCVFDDVVIEEIPWVADDGHAFKIPWKPLADGKWFRPAEAGQSWALKAEAGSVAFSPDRLHIAECVVVPGENEPGAAPRMPGYVEVPASGATFVAVPEAPREAAALTFKCVRPGSVARVAVRLQEKDPLQERFVIGPYHFSEPKIPDPSDYLDFTPEEWERIEASPDADKLKRQAKFIDLVGTGEQYSVWSRQGGRWRVADGVLAGHGDGAAVRFWQEIEGPVDLVMRVQLPSASSIAGVTLGESDKDGVQLHIGVGPAADGAANWAEVPSAETWHDVTFRLRDDYVAWTVDGGEEERCHRRRGVGGGMLLQVVRGRARFDDVAMSVPRHLDHEGLKHRFYAFDRRETDWSRRGTWIDHGGISCALASNWISLVSPDEKSMLIHKESFGRDVLVSFNIEENTEWIGWNQNPSHIHHPFDNICVALGTDKTLSAGYRLVVNGSERSETALFRNGEKVAAVRQNSSFPIRYVGGHAPYRPRRNRICLIRRGATIAVLINGKTVLTYEDPEPQLTPAVAIGGFETRTNISRVVVRELPPPEPGHVAQAR